MSYRDLEVWKRASVLSVEIHRMTLRNLPSFEMYEEGAQIRRSSKSVRSNIVEGYGRRRYKQEFIRYLCLAESSCDETIDHLEILFDTGSLQEVAIYQRLRAGLKELARMIHGFRRSVEKAHSSMRSDTVESVSNEVSAVEPD